MFELTKIPQDCDYDVAQSVIQNLGPSELSFKEKPILTFLLLVTPPPRLPVVGLDDIECVEYNIKTKILSWYVARSSFISTLVIDLSQYLKYYRSAEDSITGTVIAYALPKFDEHVIEIKL